jgi:GT2 family glycosyltransferase
LATNHRVSVLLTVFNAQPYLRAAIDSILTQTYTDFELIAIDDCSSDDGWSVIVEAGSRDSRITPLRRSQQGGASAALNQGLAIATGEFVTRQDGDDVSLPTRLAEQVAYLDAHQDVGAVGTGVTLVDDEGKPFSTWAFPERDEDIQPTLLERMCFCGPTVMVRRRVLDDLQFRFDEALSGSEDYDQCLRIAEVTRLANVPPSLYLYRQHPASVSRSREHEQLARKAAALEHALDRRFGSTSAPERSQAVARDYVTAAVMAHFRGAPPRAEWLERARALHPPVLEDWGWLARVIRSCASSVPVTVALTRLRPLFLDVLPQCPSSSRLERTLTAEIHMTEVFAAANSRDRTRIRQHLWSAVRSNPRWLANRGVLSLLLRDVITRRPAGSRT